MKKNIAIILLAIVAGILLYYLLSQGKQPDSHKFEYELAKADRDAINVKYKSAIVRIDSLKFDIRQQDTVIKSLYQERGYIQRDLDKSTSKAVQLANEIKALQQPDNSVYDHKCDSLAVEAENFAFLYGQYKSFNDSLKIVVDQQRAGYETVIAEQKQLYTELYDKYEQVSKLYDNLFKDYTGARKSLKREKLKSKVAALLGLLGGGAAVKVLK